MYKVLKMQQRACSISVFPNIFILSSAILLLILVRISIAESRPYSNSSILAKNLMATPTMKISGVYKNTKLRIKRNSPISSRDVTKSEEDIVTIVKYPGGSSDSDIFDMRRQDTLVCNLCVWIQPHYAVQQGFGSLSAGISETLDVIQLLGWIFRAMDINMDTVPDSIALTVGEILVQDFDLPVTPSPTSSGPSASKVPLDSKDPAGSSLAYSTIIGRVVPKTMLPFLENALNSKFPKKSCCATLAFIYHDVPKVLSFSSLRGLCSPHNVAVITGYHSEIKITFYDVFRATFHALSHLFGAHHDEDKNCGDESKGQGQGQSQGQGVSEFLNPFVMEPDHSLNVGARPNSMRLSYCSKSAMAVFLSSNLVNCLTSRKETFCGNGMTEEGEECDCGAPWQCMLGDQCCGTSDSFFPCKLNNIIQSLKSGRCPRPTEW